MWNYLSRFGVHKSLACNFDSVSSNELISWTQMLHAFTFWVCVSQLTVIARLYPRVWVNVHICKQGKIVIRCTPTQGHIKLVFQRSGNYKDSPFIMFACTAWILYILGGRSSDSSLFFNFSTVNGLIEILGILVYLDICQANGEMFEENFSQIVWFPGRWFSLAYRILAPYALDWIHGTRINDLKSKHAVKSSICELHCLNCHKKFLLIDEGLHRNSLRYFQIVLSFEGKRGNKSSLIGQRHHCSCEIAFWTDLNRLWEKTSSKRLLNFYTHIVICCQTIL